MKQLHLLRPEITLRESRIALGQLKIVASPSSILCACGPALNYPSSSVATWAWVALVELDVACVGVDGAKTEEGEAQSTEAEEGEGGVQDRR